MRKSVYFLSFVVLLAGISLPLCAQKIQDELLLRPSGIDAQSMLNELKKKDPVKESSATDRSKRTKQTQDIVRIDIVGASKEQEDEIRKLITVKPWEKTTSIRLEQDEKRILEMGCFSEAKSRLRPTKGGEILEFIVVQNPTIGGIQFLGRTIASYNALIDVIQNKPGQPLNVALLRDDIRAIDELYAKKGFTQMRVSRVESPLKNDDQLVFFIEEGYIEQIIITGNHRTKAYVIMREFQTKPGDALHDPTLTEDLRRIFNLNYFTNLEPKFLPGVTDNSYILNLEIEERNANAQLSFGGGYSPQSGFSIFTDLFWDNLFGSGQLVLLKGQFGRANTYQFKYQNPWMWDPRKSFTFKTWYTNGSVAAVNPVNTSGQAFRDERSQGVEVGIGWPYTYRTRTTHSMKYESVYLSQVNKDYSILSYTFGASYDTRDFWFNPRAGAYHSYQVEKGIPIYDKSLDFTKHELNIRNFFPTLPKQTIATRLTVGYLQSSQLHDQDLYTREFFRTGGSFTVRGYDDLKPFSYGNKQVLTSAEYRFLFNNVFTMVLFVDAGYSSLGSDIFDTRKYRIGKGIGIRVQVPGLGPLRLDFGIGNSNNYIHFNLGHVF